MDWLAPRHGAEAPPASGRAGDPEFGRAGTSPPDSARVTLPAQMEPEHDPQADQRPDGWPWQTQATPPRRGDPAPPAFRRAPAPGSDPAARGFGSLCHDVLGAGWVDGRIATLEQAIHPAACLRTGMGAAEGPGAIMAAALTDLGTIEDLAYFAENTMTSPTGPDDLCPQGLAALSAEPHRTAGAILSLRGSLTGRMLAPAPGFPGQHGTATHPVRRRVMADMWCANGQVLDGWLLHDSTGTLAQAGGPTPADWARARLHAAGGPDRMPPPLTPDSDPDGVYVARSPAAGRCDWAETLAERMRRIMDGDLSVLDRGSDPACAHTLPGGVTGLGAASARAFWAGLRAALPSAAFRVEHRHGAAPPLAAPQAALRWSLYGRHDGPGRFGAPTGCFLHVLGMTQVEFGPGGVRREWTVIDDCAIWTQIVMATGSA